MCGSGYAAWPALAPVLATTAARFALAAALAFLVTAISASAPSKPLPAKFAQKSRTSETRQRVQRGLRITGWGARPARTSSCHQETDIEPTSAQAAASIRETSAKLLASLCELVVITGPMY